MAKQDEIRQIAESSLLHFIALVAPNRLLGSVHKELISWWNRSDAKSHQMVLLPRDHMKSALIAYRAAHAITVNPAVRILYISSTANLAEKQLGFIKHILTSPQYKKYWPEMVNDDEGKREKWSLSEISVDHPLRKVEAIRDPTVFTAGLTTNVVGMHCDIAILDDAVTNDTAYTEEGRDKVARQYSLLASIEGADAKEWIVGTRYHPKDLYNELMSKKVELYAEDGELESDEPLYEIFERRVESVGDGTGEYLWPRQQRTDGKWFGFDQAILARKRSQYIDKTQFRAQYYNDPNDISNASIKQEYFQYYDRAKLKRTDGKWSYGGKRLNVFAAIDFAYSLRQRADFSSIVVCGIDPDNSIYILDIERFKTTLISDYFEKILRLHVKWDFRKLRCEVTAAQQVIVQDLKDNYIRRNGLALSIVDHRPTRHDGAKEERLEAILQPRYSNRQIWHYMGGNTQALEEELYLQNPPHDDIKDALASCIEICIPPTGGMSTNRMSSWNNSKLINQRFGGIAFN
jgi:hypothetical protein